MNVSSDQPTTYLFSDAYLRNFSTEVFTHFGVPGADAEQAADVLARSDLRGIDSHGVARLHTYFEMLESGPDQSEAEDQNRPRESQRRHRRWRQRPGLGRRPEGQRDRHGQSRAAWLRLGQRLQHEPLRHRRLLSVEGARTRPDRLGDDQLDQAGRAALGRRTNARHQSRSPSPFPGSTEPPIVIDMATSAVAYGKIEIALRKNEPCRRAGSSTKMAATRPTRTT